MTNLYFAEIENLKKKFLHLYILMMCSAFIIFIIIYQFYIYAPVMVIYLLGGLLFLSYTYMLIKGKYSANRIMHGIMIIAPIYNFYILLTFWENSIASIVSLFLLPLFAYVFFSKTEIISYTLYLIFNIGICFFVRHYFHYKFITYARDQVIFADAILFAFNLTIIILLFIYNNKIQRLKILVDIVEKETPEKQIVDDKNTVVVEKNVKGFDVSDETSERIFKELESMMNDNQMFKLSNLNISILSTTMNINYNYLSKIIRCKGYQNFNNYVNTHRINHIKKLIDEGNVQKMTLMYVYTEAGFTNQTTFNRVFKQIEGITPSEYISIYKNSKS